MGRAPCCDRANVKRGPWSPEEDEALRNYLHKHGSPGNWISLPHKAGLKRCGKSCRLRWLNYLRPHIKRGRFTEEEDNIILSLYGKIGSRWSVIARKLPGRTDNDVKNHWNTNLKKKLFGGGEKLKKMPNHEPNNITSNTKTGSNTNPNSLPSVNNHNISTSLAQPHLCPPSFSSLQAQGNYNPSPLGHNETLIFDQFMFSSPSNPQGEQPSHGVDQLVSTESQEAFLSNILGSSLSLIDRNNNYLGYPFHRSHVKDDLLLDDCGLGFEAFIPCDDLKESIDPSYGHGIS